MAAQGRSGSGVDSDASSTGGGLSHPEYRPEIDGLRAVAVLSVLGYHAFPDAIRGGFTGVDIFFIISGFLISGILLGNLERGTFSLLTFYTRRVQRIFPALLVVLAACLAAGWVVMLASEYAQLGKHVAAGAAFISNLVLWRETGYFDSAAEAKPLLHLWSLGIEEQFYIFWPLLLYGAWRLRFRAVTLILLIIAASFAVNIHYVGSDAAAAFYSPLARFWELLIGGCLAYVGLHKSPMLAALDVRLSTWLARGTGPDARTLGQARLRDLQAALGALMIVLALVLLDRRSVFPGWWALLPTLGATLVIGAGGQAWFNRAVLSNRLMVGVGLISYPMYLWHWPLLSFAQIIGGARPAPEIRAAAVAGSIVLAAATYWFVEKPLRFGRYRRRMPPLLVVAMIAVGATGYAAYAQNGFGFRPMARHSEETRIAEEDQAVRREFKIRPCDEESLIVGRARGSCKESVDAAPTQGVMVLWGDSHGAAWDPLFSRMARARNEKLVIFSTLGFPPLLHVRRSDSLGTTLCSELGLGEDVVASIENLHPREVIVVARWSMYANGWYQDGMLRDATHFLTSSATGAATLATSREALARQLDVTVQALIKASSGPVLLIKNPPVLKSGIGVGLLRRPGGYEPSAQESAAWEAFSSALIDREAADPRVRIFDPSAYLCREKCSAYYKGTAMYTDDNHISAQGALQFSGEIGALLH
jgi:peptidoglycan/LPS O-acetylase OafA/YrhL